MANLIAYVLSKNTYPTASEAGNVATAQGTQIVYATTSTLTTSNELFLLLASCFFQQFIFNICGNLDIL